MQTLPIINEILIVTNDKFYSKFEEWKSTYASKISIKILNDGSTSPDDRLEALGDIQFALKDIDDEVLILAGDNLFEFELQDFYNYYKEKQTPITAAFDTKDIEIVRNRHGVVILNNQHKVIDFQEKPEEPKSTIKSIACYIYTKETKHQLDDYLETNESKAPGFFLEWLSKQTDVYAYITDKQMHDIGNLESYKKTDALYKKRSEQTKELLQNIKDAKQNHILKFWDELNQEQKSSLLQQIKTINFDLLEKLIKQYIHEPEQEESLELKPAPVITIPETEEQLKKQEKAKEIGEQAIKEGKVGIFLVAGGQGTRLGYNGPKGCYKISPIKNKSIFELHAEKIKAYENKYNVTLPWYIMTSEDNHEQTLEFFEQHKYFNLEKENIMFFKQAMIPAVTNEGNLILCQKDKIFMNPDGHGGSISALMHSKALKDIKQRGIKYISYFQVDNILIKILDPIFIGYHIMEKAEMSSKVLEKNDPKEKVGVVGYVNNKLSVIEYSCLPDDLAEERENGKLKFWAGSIAIHILNTDFIEEMNLDEFSLPYYKANKAVAYIDDQGNLIEPDEPNAIKFEKFIFDALKKTTKSVTMEIIREHEFAPVKNKKGIDSADSAKKLILDYHKSWLNQANIEVPEDTKVEISSLFALDKDELEAKIDKNLKIQPNSEVYLR